MEDVSVTGAKSEWEFSSLPYSHLSAYQRRDGAELLRLPFWNRGIVLQPSHIILRYLDSDLTRFALRLGSNLDPHFLLTVKHTQFRELRTLIAVQQNRHSN